MPSARFTQAEVERAIKAARAQNCGFVELLDGAVRIDVRDSLPKDEDRKSISPADLVDP